MHNNCNGLYLNDILNTRWKPPSELVIVCSSHTIGVSMARKKNARICRTLDIGNQISAYPLFNSLNRGGENICAPSSGRIAFRDRDLESSRTPSSALFSHAFSIIRCMFSLNCRCDETYVWTCVQRRLCVLRRNKVILHLRMHRSAFQQRIKQCEKYQLNKAWECSC